MKPIHINLDDPAQVDALFDACLRIRGECRYAAATGTDPEKLIQAHIANLHHQLRTADEITRDNAEAQADHEHERAEGWSVR